MIAVPEGHAPDTALTPEKIANLQAAAEEEKKERAAFAVAMEAAKATFQSTVETLAKNNDAVRVTVSAILPSGPELVVVASSDGQTGCEAGAEDQLAFKTGKTISLDGAETTQFVIPVANSAGRVAAVVSVTLVKAELKSNDIASAVAAILP